MSKSRLIPLPGAKSKVWKYFAFEVDEKGKFKNNSVVFFQVSKCDARIAYSKNTTNMLLHLKRHHPSDYSEIATSTSNDDNSSTSSSAGECNSKKFSQQTTITDAYHSVEPYRKSNPRYKACEEALTQFVCLLAVLPSCTLSKPLTQSLYQYQLLNSLE